MADNRGQGADVDDAPFTGDLDLDAVSTRDELIARLKTVHVRADAPSLRTLETRTRHNAVTLSKTATAEMLRGVRFPRKAMMIAFLQACGVQDSDMDAWRRAWERVASGQGSVRGEDTQAVATPADPNEVNQLREQVTRLSEVNEQLRSRLAKTRFGAAGEVSPDDPPGGPEKYSAPGQTVWHFSDSSPITLVSYRLPPDRRPPSADPDDPNYVRFAELADLDTVIDVYGAVSAYNPTSRVTIMAAQDLTQRDVATHLVLIGGLTWEAVTPWFTRIFSIPLESGDPFERGAIVVRDPDGAIHEFKCTLVDNKIVEDVGFLVYGRNPSAPQRTLTLCGGITTRGVHGAALCFIDGEMRERNGRYLMSQVPDGSACCVVMRVPIINNDPLTPDLSKKDNRLFEWGDRSPLAG
jgi:hypothetical protein